MESKDFDAFGVFMSILQETFSPEKPISKERTKIYFEILFGFLYVRLKRRVRP